MSRGRPGNHGEPALVRALDYPNRRVQMAAADALMRIPGQPGPEIAGRIVEVWRRRWRRRRPPRPQGNRRILTAKPLATGSPTR